jgi:predicted DNA-binding transcriptional regulator AlpA
MSKVRRALAGDEPILGAREAAAVLGVSQSNLRELVGLPEPFQTLAMGNIWLRSDIEAFRDRRAASPARPGPKPRAAVAA